MAIETLRPEEKQRKASNPEKSVWVSASAGTGKTKVLTDRVLTLLLSDINPEKILCLTFTKAAAAEMSNRIAERLKKWAVCEDEELQKELLELLGKDSFEKELKNARKLFALVLDKEMKIQTIHSFCQTVLKKFPIEAGIAPHFNVMSDIDSSEVMKKARDAVFSQNRDTELAKACETVAGKIHEMNFSSFMQAITSERGKIKRMLANYGSKENVIKAIYKLLETDENETPQTVINSQSRFFDNEGMKKVCELCLESKSVTDNAAGKRIDKWLSSKEKTPELFDEYKLAFLTQAGEKRASFLTKPSQKKMPDAVDIMEEEAEKVIKTIEKLKAVEVAKCSAALVIVATALLEYYRNYKKTRALMDYDDQILTVKELLEEKDSTPWILYKLDGGIDHILVDEAQDTSPEQWAIIKALTTEFFAGKGAKENQRTVFAVGDRKQSIYSFQGASPEAFEKMRKMYSYQIPEAEKEWEEVSLDISFRSTQAVLDAVKTVIEHSKDGVLLPEEDGTHLSFRQKEGGLVEIWPALETKKSDDQLPWSPPVERITRDNAQARAARLIAEKIYRMIKEKDILVSKDRPVQAGDIMVLVRRRNNFVNDLIKNLKKHNVSVAGADRMVLSEQMAVMDLLAVGNFMLLPNDDLNLAGLLKSPFFALSEEELFELAYDRKTSLWETLSLAKETKDIYRRAFEKLSLLLSMADKRPYEIYSFLLGKMEGKKQLISRLGLEAEDPIDEFMSQILLYELSNIPSLQGFIHWLQTNDLQIKRDMEQSELNSVRIMTIHGAKGLQAPIVFLPDTLQVPMKTPPVLWSSDIISDDTALMLWPSKKEFYTDICNTIDERNKLERDREYRRLLYVAMTRAEDRLYICGFNTEKKAPEHCWYNTIKEALEPVAQNTACPFLEQSEYIENSEIMRISCLQQKKIKEKAERGKEIAETALPEWINKDITEGNITQLVPSKLGDVPAFSPVGRNALRRYTRGKVIHKLLQSLPDVEKEKRQEIAERFIKRLSGDFDEKQKNEIISETIGIIENPKFKDLFSKTSRAEISLAGKILSHPVAGQIDRLVITDDSVIIVDYKTNRPPPVDIKNVPEIYIRQMAVYKKIASEIFPEKAVRCVLLWTDGPFITEIESSFLDKAADNLVI